MNSEPSDQTASKNDKMILAHDILIVDDEISNLKLLTEYLGQAGYQVRPTEKPQQAIDSALAKPPALILLDVRMPEMDGFEVCKRLKQDKRTRGIPIIFISALQDVQDKVLGFEAGGVDYITKPFQEEEVLARVRTHVELRNMQLTLEKIVDERTAELTATRQRDRSIDLARGTSLVLMVAVHVITIWGYRDESVGGSMVCALVTNFHTPRSSLLVMVSAFAGRKLILKAYEEAVRQKYRFFSYGDAMLIL